MFHCVAAVEMGLFCAFHVTWRPCSAQLLGHILRLHGSGIGSEKLHSSKLPGDTDGDLAPG